MDEQGPLTDLPEHAQCASIAALFRRDKRARTAAALATIRDQPLGDSLLADDKHRRAIFIAKVTQKVMEMGTSKTAAYLTRVYHFPRAAAFAIIKEARMEMAAECVTQTDELRAIAEARIEHMMKMAQDALDITNYGRAVKEWCRLHGLYRQDDTTMGDFAALVRKVTAEANVKDAEFKVLDLPEDEEAFTPVEWNTPPALPEGSDEPE